MDEKKMTTISLDELDSVVGGEDMLKPTYGPYFSDNEKQVITEDVQARKSAQQTLLECQSVWNQRYTNWKLGRNMSVLSTIVSDAYNA